MASSESEKSSLTGGVPTRALRALLYPVVAFCVRRSIRLPEILEMLKALFIQAAEQELLRTEAKPSASRISAMTGVHRKDIARLNSEDRIQSRPKNVISRIMVQWRFDSRFSTKPGVPRSLLTEGRESEFAELVESVNGGDLSSYAVLFEMERMGIVVVKSGKVTLQWENYVPPVEVETGLQMLAEDCADLLSAVETNIYEESETPNLHLKTVFDNIVESAVPSIRRWLLREGSAFHHRLRAHLAQFDKDLSPNLQGESGGVRVAIGSFSTLRANCLEDLKCSIDEKEKNS